MTRYIFSASAAAALAFALPGCVSVLPEQPTPEAVYRIAAPEGSVPLKADVVIREPDAPRLFASRSIAAEGSDGGFRLVPNVAWADRATRMLQVTMVDSFEMSGEGVAVDDATGVSGVYELYWRVTDFSLKGTEGYCSLQLTLLSGRTRDPVAQQSVSASVPAAGSNPQSRAQALAAAGRDCVAKGARFVSDAAVVPGTSETAETD